MKRFATFLLAVTFTAFFTNSTGSSETGAALGKGRPHILGVAHMALYVSDLQAARAFYKDLLGFAEVFSLKRDDGSDRIAFIKINDDQYIELFAESPRQEGHLNHIAFFTDSAEAMRDYLASS
jgi:lactoylglutathione lyase